MTHVQKINYYRPAPYNLTGNPYIEILKNNLRELGWVALDFKYWRIFELWRNRKKCHLIHIHWPEAYWRSGSLMVSLIKCLHFIFIHIMSKALGYKWIFSSHNVMPHYQILSPTIESIMRRYILFSFDAVIGHAKNAQQDLNYKFGHHGRKFIYASHGLYSDYYKITVTREDFRRAHNLSDADKILLLLDTSERENKGTTAFIDTWIKLGHQVKVKLIIAGGRSIKRRSILDSRDDMSLLEGRVKDDELASILNGVDFLVMPYKSITTSGLYFLALTFNLPVICSNLPFFVLNGSEKTMLQFDLDKPLENEVRAVLKKIQGGWTPDQACIIRLKREHDPKSSASIIASLYSELLTQ